MDIRCVKCGQGIKSSGCPGGQAGAMSDLRRAVPLRGGSPAKGLIPEILPDRGPAHWFQMK